MTIDWPEGDHSFIHTGPNNIRYSWNQAVRDVLATGSDYLWSCHNDVTMQPGTLKRLLSWDKPLVGATLFMKQGPALPHIWDGYIDGQLDLRFRIKEMVDWYKAHKDAVVTGAHIIEPRPDDALYGPISFTSTSCLLIHRSVLEAMQDPWFEWDDDYIGGGEDRRFFENARSAGFPGFVDRSCVVGHGEANVGAQEFMIWAAVTSPECFVSEETVAAAVSAMRAVASKQVGD
jgi:hypothetical protein